MNKKFLFPLLALLLVFSSGCKQKAETSQATSAITVFTSILPQKYFVERIAGDRVHVEVLVGPGKEPATYEPTPQQVISLGDAKILFTIGVPFEKGFLPNIRKTLPSLNIVDTSQGITKRTLEAHHHHGEEEHGDEDHEEHAHDEDEEHGKILDPHVWLSPELVKTQAKNIYNALVEIDAQGKDQYEANYKNFVKDLDDLQAELKKSFTPYKGETFFVFHPAFGYLADEFGLKQEAIETGGKEPAPSVLQEIIEEAQEDKVKIVFVQEEFSQTSAKKVAEAIGGVVVSINPLNPDYINNIKHMSQEIQKAFQ